MRGEKEREVEREGGRGEGRRERLREREGGGREGVRGNTEYGNCIQ